MKNLFKTDIFTEIELVDLKEKEENLRYGLLITPGDREMLEDLAIVLYHKRDYDGAIHLYKKIVDEEKDDIVEKYAFLGYLYFENEDYQNAIKYYRKSLDIEPNAFVLFLLGNAYSRSGLIMDAVRNYDYAIFLNFDIYKAHLSFAQKYENMKLYKCALKEYTIAYEIDPRDKEIEKKIKKMKKKLEKEKD